MKRVILLHILAITFLISGTPTMDGVFDGEGTWGTPMLTADGTIGWAGANAKKLYVTYDATYIYFGAEVTASDWQAWAFVIHTKSGGATSDSWARNISYAQTEKPDYDARGHFGSYAEIHTWNGASWDGSGGLAATEFGENIVGNDQNGWVEIRVPRSSIVETIGDVQFYITGNNNDHGSFDAVPNDDNSTDWSGAAGHSDLVNYQTNITLPVELTSFTAIAKGKNVELNWNTATEVNNYGFEVERKIINNEQLTMNSWQKIGFVEGSGTTNLSKSYNFVDASVSGKVSYRLKQIDRDGKFEYSNSVEATVADIKTFGLDQNYPNPFNPATVISYQLPVSGQVSLKVYDMLGKEVASLVNETKEAGSYSAKFDGSQLSSGIYFYTLQSGNFTATKKLTLMK